MGGSILRAEGQGRARLVGVYLRRGRARVVGGARDEGTDLGFKDDGYWI